MFYLEELISKVEWKGAGAAVTGKLRAFLSNTSSIWAGLPRPAQGVSTAGPV